MNFLYLKKITKIGLIGAFLLFSSFETKQQKTDKISLDLLSKTLYKGKSVSLKSEVYYRNTGALMVTHFTSPQEKIIITNNNGEYKDYDFKTNTVTLMQGLDLSSKNSLFYNFLSGSTSDMGLKLLGYKLLNTRIENKMVITTWVPVGSIGTTSTKAEIVHENYLPIYMAFYNEDGKPAHKSYYSNYQQVGAIMMPLTITELEYINPGDSIITKRTYSNLKTNEQVNDFYLNYKIPSNAKIVKPNNKSPK